MQVTQYILVWLFEQSSSIGLLAMDNHQSACAKRVWILYHHYYAVGFEKTPWNLCSNHDGGVIWPNCGGSGADVPIRAVSKACSAYWGLDSWQKNKPKQLAAAIVSAALVPAPLNERWGVQVWLTRQRSPSFISERPNMRKKSLLQNTWQPQSDGLQAPISLSEYWLENRTSAPMPRLHDTQETPLRFFCEILPLQYLLVLKGEHTAFSFEVTKGVTQAYFLQDCSNDHDDVHPDHNDGEHTKRKQEISNIYISDWMININHWGWSNKDIRTPIIIIFSENNPKASLPQNYLGVELLMT